MYISIPFLVGLSAVWSLLLTVLLSLARGAGYRAGHFDARAQRLRAALLRETHAVAEGRGRRTPIGRPLPSDAARAKARRSAAYPIFRQQEEK